MHTISQRTGFLFKAGLAALAVAELVVTLLWHAAVQVVIWQERARQRRHLASLDDYLLRDLGLSRGEIHVEVRKPFWQG